MYEYNPFGDEMFRSCIDHIIRWAANTDYSEALWQINELMTDEWYDKVNKMDLINDTKKDIELFKLAAEWAVNKVEGRN